MKPSSKAGIRTFLCAGLLLGGGALRSQAQSSQQASPDADNTKVNVRDRNANEPTADQQKNNRSDLQITQQIRKSIMDDKSLSAYAHNVKVITQQGQVTLKKGPVRSDGEKQTIETKAAEVAGQDKVTSELSIKAQQ